MLSVSMYHLGAFKKVLPEDKVDSVELSDLNPPPHFPPCGVPDFGWIYINLF